VAGEGWFAIGNLAGFTNPLISPGINARVGSAVLAATLTKNILSTPSNSDSKAEMQKSIQIYQTYSHDFMLPRLHQMNRYWYNMFRDHRLFEVFLVCHWALAIEDIDE
jgi:flavin-dependent dehydrogenase